MTADEAFFKFRAIEDSLGCATQTLDGFPFWMHLRFHLYTYHIQPFVLGSGNAHPDLALGGKRNFVLGLVKAVRRAVKAISLMASRIDVLFALEPRMMPVEARGNVPIMLDFFWSRMTNRRAVLQYKSGKDLASLPRDYLTFEARPNLFVKRAAKKLVRSSATQKAIKDALTPIIKELNDEFCAKISVAEIQRIVSAQMIQYKSMYPTLKKFLRKRQVKCVVTSVNYHPVNMVLNDVARELSIPVVEMQHGFISRTHIAYHLPVGCRYGRPDYLLTWGRRWQDFCENYFHKGAVAVGYPFMEHALLTYPRKRIMPHKILFISQGTVGRLLSKTAEALSRELPGDEAVVCYKLHPSETKSWRTIYPRLVGSAVRVLDNTDCNIYEAMAGASAVLGADSTALIECTAWGHKPFVFTDLPSNSNDVAAILGRRMIRCKGSDIGLLGRMIMDHIRAEGVEPDLEDGEIFMGNAAERMVEQLSEIRNMSA